MLGKSEVCDAENFIYSVGERLVMLEILCA